jgi:hypothetical protein
MVAQRVVALFSTLLVSAAVALATANYEYGPDEYDTIANGISPDGKYAITSHGSGDLGYDNFHLYLTDAISGKNIAPLVEVVDTLDTKATAFFAKWSADSTEVMIFYRVDRHEPLKAVSYRIANHRPQHLKGPFDVKSQGLLAYLERHYTEPKASPKIFGTPLKHD